jgi:hypothetical protein
MAGISSGDKYRAVPLSEAIISAKEELRLGDTTMHDKFLMRLANQAMVSMTDNATYVVRSCDVEVTDGGRAELPCGFVRLIAARWNNGTTNQAGPVYGESAFIQDGTIPAGFTPWTNDFRIIEDRIVFLNPLTPDGYLTVVFSGRNIDEDGLMVMSDRQERAITAYLCYKFAKSYPERYLMGFWQDSQMEWKAQKAHLTGMSAMERFHENKQQIASIVTGWPTSDRNRVLSER